MDIKKTDTYYSIAPSKSDTTSTEEGFQAFYNEFLKNNANFKKINIILDFSKLINIDLNKILLFSQLSESHRNDNNSFVIVCTGLDFNDIPDEIITVPTFQEAEDIIEIENIERDLGM